MRGARGEGRGGAASGRAIVALVTLLALRPSPVAPQQPGTYAERAATSILVQSGETSTRRTLLLDARYEVTRRADTLVVQVARLELRSTAGDETVRHDTDGFVGGRWKLLPAAAGWRTVEAPFVPAALQDVADLAGRMDDFFPPRPPEALLVGTSTTDAHGITWHRLPGDGTRAMHGWSREREVDTVHTVTDALAATTHERHEERGDGAWLPDGAAGWTRRVVTVSETVVAGRLIRARVEEEVRVAREP